VGGDSFVNSNPTGFRRCRLVGTNRDRMPGSRTWLTGGGGECKEEEAAVREIYQWVKTDNQNTYLRFYGFLLQQDLRGV